MHPLTVLVIFYTKLDDNRVGACLVSSIHIWGELGSTVLVYKCSTTPWHLLVWGTQVLHLLCYSSPLFFHGNYTIH